MGEFVSLFAKNDDGTRLLIRSKPLLWCLSIGCYLLLIYSFGFVIGTVASPFVGMALGICNRKFVNRRA